MADHFQIKADGRDRLEILPILSILLPHIWINILFIARSAHVTQSHKNMKFKNAFWICKIVSSISVWTNSDE